MSGNYPDGVNQAVFDAYWNELLDDDLDEQDDSDLDHCPDPDLHEPVHAFPVIDDEFMPF